MRGSDRGAQSRRLAFVGTAASSSGFPVVNDEIAGMIMLAPNTASACRAFSPHRPGPVRSRWLGRNPGSTRRGYMTEWERSKAWIETALIFSGGTHEIEDVERGISERKMMLISGRRSPSSSC